MNWIRAVSCEGDKGKCVEVTFDGGQVGVRNSEAPADVLWFSREEWDVFIASARKGDFDL